MNTDRLSNIPDDAIIEARWGSDTEYRSGGVTQLGTAAELKDGLRDSAVPSRQHSRESTAVFGSNLCDYAPDNVR